MNLNCDNGLYIDDLSSYEHSGSLLGEHYSPSFIKAWCNCPAKIAFGVLCGSEKSDAMKIGSSVHRILESKYSDANTSKVVEEERAACGELFSSVENYLNSYNTIEPYDGFDESSDFFTEREIVSEVKPLGVTLPAKLKGFVDRIDIGNNGVFVVDYKTSSKKPSKNNHTDQLIIYKWLVEESLGIGVNGCYIASIRKEKSEYIKSDITLVAQSKLIDKIFETDEEVRKSIDSGLYAKKPSNLCNFCPAREYCKNNLKLEGVRFDG